MWQSFENIFCFDPISLIMLTLVSFIGVCIGTFSSRYLDGDARYRPFFFNLVLMILFASLMVCANHLLLFFLGWCGSNFFLVKLMSHKKSWEAARQSGLYAAKNFLLGATALGAGLLLLFMTTGKTSITQIIQSPHVGVTPLILLLLGGMTQSAIWPFHRPLLSSLNSPTPVSAIMHAGLINGGGFLLARFAPLYLNHSTLLTTIFAFGLVTALLGTFWKLLQHDVKRMLACSTMGQMGFMLAQCGLGLFPAAIAHLVFHGMYKAYLFLATGSAAAEKRHDKQMPVTLFAIVLALGCGVLGSYCFSLTSGKEWFAPNTTFVLMVIAFLTAAQFSLPILQFRSRFKIPLAAGLTAVMGMVYGWSVALIAKMMAPMHLMQPQPLNWVHVVAIALLTLSWLAILVVKTGKPKPLHPWLAKGYVAALNASQPHPKTITTNRNLYRYS